MSVSRMQKLTVGLFAAACLVLAPTTGFAQDEAAEAGDEEANVMMLSEDVLERYGGEYELAPGFTITVTREGQQLFGQGTGQPQFEMFAESETKFFLTVTDAQIEFNVEGDGPAGSITLYQAGQEVPGTRVE